MERVEIDRVEISDQALCRGSTVPLVGGGQGRPDVRPEDVMPVRALDDAGWAWLCLVRFTPAT